MSYSLTDEAAALVKQHQLKPQLVQVVNQTPLTNPPPPPPPPPPLQATMTPPATPNNPHYPTHPRYAYKQGLHQGQPGASVPYCLASSMHTVEQCAA